MIKIYQHDKHWVAECTVLNIMVEASEPIEVIGKLCDTLKYFLIESYHRGKLDKILNDQKG